MKDTDEGESERDTDARIARNLEVLEEDLVHFRERYWPTYQKFGLTFGEAYAAYVAQTMPVCDGDHEEDEPWKS
jgi:hypothetical protein